MQAGRLSIAAAPTRTSQDKPNSPGNQIDRFFSKVTSRLLGPQGSSTDLRLKQESSEAVAEFWRKLSEIAWCPVMTEAPVAGIPWLAHSTPTATPALVRPKGDMWLCSASYFVLDRDCGSSALATALGWSAPLTPEVLACQLAALGEQYKHVDDTATRQLLAGVVPKLYHSLASLSASVLDNLRTSIEDSNIVWVGDGFVPINKVAFRGPLDLSPLLYVIPLELAPFQQLLQSLGVQPSFSAEQYASVLSTMAAEAAGAPLQGTKLEQALSVVAVLSDMSLPAQSLFLPNERGILLQSSDLAFNDAPWMETGLPDGVQFVHRRVANETAEHLGAASLRRLLLAQGADGIRLGLVDSSAGAEAFGQSEALTTRLRHILESYTDGPGVLMELVQNADDAGATNVKFMLDQSHYPDGSLLGPKMAQWQGPALLAFNDAVFSSSDLHAISRIGQDSKMKKPATTGRFGLGFNSIYHYTGNYASQ